MSIAETPPPVPPPRRQRTSGCAIAAMIVVGIVLFLPGLCVSLVALSDAKIDWRVLLFILGGVIIAVLAAYEIWRRRASR